MLFPFLKRWKFLLQENQFSLYREKHCHSHIAVHPDLPLDEQIMDLVAKIPVDFPWQNSIEFILDIPYVRYALIPWQPGLLTPAEQRQYAATLIETQHNMSADATKITFFDHRYGENAFAAAIESDLFVTLKNIASGARLRFQGCSTPFTHVLNNANKKLPENIILACIGKDISSYAIRYQQCWHSVLSLHMPEAEAAEQIKIISQLAGVPELPWEQVGFL